MNALDEDHAHFLTLQELMTAGRMRALADPTSDFVRKLGMTALGKRQADQRAAIEEYFDEVAKSLRELFLVRLVATVERMAFERLSTTIGETRKLASPTAFPAGTPFARAAHLLVKSAKDVNDLAGIEGLLKCYPQAPLEEFQALRKHRNRASHGSRDHGEEPPFISIDEAHEVLSHLLSIIDHSA